MKALTSIRALLGRFRRDEQGATIMLVTVMIVAILGFAAMVTDSGAAYWNRRMLQNGVDGASLAGASQLAITVTPGTGVITVSANYQAPLLVPFINGILPNPTTLVAASTMRLENGGS